MPELCRFYGIVIKMYFRDHGPPHFHVRYGDYRAVVRIGDSRVMKGRLPRTAERLVTEWANQRHHELEEAWRRAADNQHPGRIAPLE